MCIIICIRTRSELAKGRSVVLSDETCANKDGAAIHVQTNTVEPRGLTPRLFLLQERFFFFV